MLSHGKNAYLPRRILVIEDDETQLKAYRAIGKRYGIEVSETGRAIDAFRLALLGRPELILLDLRLEDGDGVRLLESLRASPETARTPVLVVSGQLADPVKDACLRAGASAVLPKPWSVDELLAAMGAQLERQITAASHA